MFEPIKYLIEMCCGKETTNLREKSSFSRIQARKRRPSEIRHWEHINKGMRASDRAQNGKKDCGTSLNTPRDSCRTYSTRGDRIFARVPLTSNRIIQGSRGFCRTSIGGPWNKAPGRHRKKKSGLLNSSGLIISIPVPVVSTTGGGFIVYRETVKHTTRSFVT